MNIAFDFTVTMGVIATVVIAIVGWVRAGRKTVADKIDGLDGRLSRHESRLTAVEQTVTGLPGKDHIHDLRLELTEMRGELKEMRAVMEGNTKIMARVENIVARHEDHLLEGRK
ncbi:DUF2730 family protein [Pseudogemmobacter blasticus]|uniref:DUF2730 domain-containing protein n=1 Tax=Fuscovulum blasticum DSM 2131 TaxID=1188250 RepID=A0A2T4JDQ3_FUSBL|nr:DUF2730 family protein [Fuscovulum blasticum]PTE15947.1 DUF2730 domain-containing protein [Fuscovulum blasticum DSM 2131]